MTEARDYTIGWICQSIKEFAAASVSLDAIHSKVGYVLGSIGQHHVVIACTPAGARSNVEVACMTNNMIRDFPNIQITLLVGVGDGVPSANHDISLGDIVVGSPPGSHDGFLFYRPTHDRTPLPMGVSSPPDTWRKLVEVVAAHINGQKIDEIIAGTLAKNRRMHAIYKRPLEDGDDYVMVSPSLATTDRDGHYPVIHYGLIADQDCTIHDDILNYNILCFDVGAAGAIHGPPYLVIRGICNYANTDETDKDWSGYAALAAATYAKCLLDPQCLIDEVNPQLRGDARHDLVHRPLNVTKPLK